MVVHDVQQHTVSGSQTQKQKEMGLRCGEKRNMR